MRTRALNRHGRFDAVVASLGGWWQGKPIVDLDRETWLRLIDSNLLSHLTAVRAFMPPMIEAGGRSYTLINDGAAMEPVPDAGPMSMLAAAQLMLARTLAAEARGSGVRQLLIETPVNTRTRLRAEPSWLTADDIGKAAVWLASEAVEMATGSVIPLHEKPTRVA